MAYCIMLLLNSSVVVPLGLLSHCVLRYLLSRQVLLFFQKEKEEKEENERRTRARSHSVEGFKIVSITIIMKQL